MVVHSIGKQIKISKDRKIKIVVDASNGYTGEVMKKALRGVKNLKAIFLSAKPDGDFPDHGPNPNLEGVKDNLIAAVKKNKADIGAIFDGDGDRVIFVDDKGEWFDPDAVIKLYAETYKPEKIVIDEITGMLPAERKNYAKGYAPKIFRLRVGHLYIKEAMIKRSAEFGAERSGHYYFRVNGAYFDSGALMAGRTDTKPPLAPGMAPLIISS